MKGAEKRRGTKNGANKLTEAAVRDIRARYVPYKNIGQLAAKHGVTVSAVRDAVTGATWGWFE